MVRGIEAACPRASRGARSDLQLDFDMDQRKA